MSAAAKPAPDPALATTRVVVTLVGNQAHGVLAESRFAERSFLPGGEHNMYELAFAAAALGYSTELRGWLDRGVFDAMAQAAGAAPRAELPSRRPEAADIVVMPEGWQDPLEYAWLLLSPARLAIFALAPPGLFGWPFTGDDWSRPDPLTVALDAVATPESFVAMDRLGFSLLTHSPGIVAAADAAGVACAFVGTGRPDAVMPEPARERTADVAAVIANRWAPLVREVLPELEGLTVDCIEEVGNAEVQARLAKARILLWPSRIEGHATIPWEARAAGCVPVALSSNRFGVGLSDQAGAVVVDHLSELGPAIRDLLADSGRWGGLSQRAISVARQEVDWSAYLGRVDAWLRSMPTRGPEADARLGMGAALSDWLANLSSERQAAAEELEAERSRISQDRDRWYQSHALVDEERVRLEAALRELYAKREVRAALRLSRLRLR